MMVAAQTGTLPETLIRQPGLSEWGIIGEILAGFVGALLVASLVLTMTAVAGP